MHVCFALMVGVPMARLVRRRWREIVWRLYPLVITFVVVATGNHFLTDVFLGALTAGAAALLAQPSAGPGPARRLGIRASRLRRATVTDSPSTTR